jgi:ubiquinone/menaquinone biosynthesis C-methylase UbiE
MQKPRKPGRPAAKPNDRKPKSSSWGGVADWYDNYLETTPDSYQEQVIAPNLQRVLALKKGDRLLDIGCGQGYFSRKFAAAGATVCGADISQELIRQAKSRSPEISYHVAPSHQLPFAPNGSFQIATIILAIQNIEKMQETFAEAHRILAPGGRLILVLNHPAFRIPRRSEWGWDEASQTQYRRVDGYLSPSTVPIVMHPGQKQSSSTLSYHRSLQDFFKALHKAHFAVSRLEEWISHRKSDRGGRQVAEDLARREIPLFLMLEARKNG